MSTILSLDAGRLAPLAVWLEAGQVVQTVPLTGPALEGLDGPPPAEVIHRFPHAPAGVPEVVDAPDGTALVAAGATSLGEAVQRANSAWDEAALVAAGALEPEDTAARLAALASSRRRWPEARQRLVFDTPWFAGLTGPARHYGLPPEAEQAGGFQRVGRHGPIHRLATQGRAGRWVSIYLGPEASAAAVADGAPRDCTAGATGLEGLPGSRTAGDTDPAALLYLVERLGRSLAEVTAAVAGEGGWFGLSGCATLPALRGADTPAARDTLALLTDRLRRAVGALAAVMNGLDGVVVSGDDDHVDPALLDEVAAGLTYLGVPDRVPVLRTSLFPALAAARAAGGVAG